MSNYRFEADAFQRCALYRAPQAKRNVWFC